MSFLVLASCIKFLFKNTTLWFDFCCIHYNPKHISMLASLLDKVEGIHE